MGFIQKKDEEEREEIEGIQIIEREDVPDDLPENDVELVGAPSSEDAEPSATVESPASDEPEDTAEADTSDAIDDAEEDTAPADHEVDPRRRKLPLLVVCAVAIAVVAAVLGYVIGSGGFAPEGVHSATVTEDELDRPLATYTYNGAKHTVSVREAIESQYSLDVALTDEGTYTAPSAEVILTNVRNEILVADAESRGIEATDDEMASYAEETLGVSDFATLAEQYQISEDQAREIVRTNLLISKLYEQVAPEGAAEMPAQPTEPENGDESTSSAEYASYIINLLGDEWDSTTGTWARTDGEMYAAIDGANFDGTTATYAQATAAFYVAYQDYYETASTAQQTWTTYVNNLYANCNLTLLGVFQ